LTQVQTTPFGVATELDRDATRVRERLIPKRSEKLRSLGISTVRDRIVQTAAKLVLEPIFEADFCPTSYGFRPGRRAQDAIEQVRYFINAARRYEWVIEGDVEDCFESIHQCLLMEQVCRRVTDKRVLALIRLFLAGGIMREQGSLAATPSARHKGRVSRPFCRTLPSRYSTVASRRSGERDAGPASARVTGPTACPAIG
jgi:RNA-directed DNA polymerase